MGSLPSLESRTWPLSSFSVYSILTDEPFSTGGLDCAPAGAAASSTNSATRVPRKRMVRPPSRRVSWLSAAEPAYTRPRRGANFAGDVPAAMRASGGRVAQVGQVLHHGPEKDRGRRELAGGYCLKWMPVFLYPPSRLSI